jgi:LysM domain./D-alanyl-D-alanine carboxypeptidase.
MFLEYIVKAGDTFASLAHQFYDDALHAYALARHNGIKDDKQSLQAGVNIKLPAKTVSMTKKTVQGSKTNIHMKYGYRNCLSDSVGAGGKNIAGDVMLVYRKLKALEYPNTKDVNICDDKMIKGIKFFQALNKKIPHGLIKVDGKIDPGGETEKTLFGNNAKKYDPPKKTDVKPLEASIEKQKEDALSGANDKAKTSWENVMKVWKEISPYLPAGSCMESGYRSTESQRIQLYKKYNAFQDKISTKFGIDTWQKYYDLQQTKMTAEELKQSDIEMHRQICEAVSPNEVALPGKSKHELGQAADSQLADVNERIRALLWYSIEFNGTIRNITREKNDCGHFEFD